jgi:hypothetical protein
VQCEAANKADCCFAILDDLVVESYEKGADIFCLRQVLVELLVQVC